MSALTEEQKLSAFITLTLAFVAALFAPAGWHLTVFFALVLVAPNHSGV